jgi:hypothetical protein
MYTPIVTAKLNDVDPQVWLADIRRRIADHPTSRLDELLRWNWRRTAANTAAGYLKLTRRGFRRIVTLRQDILSATSYPP